MDARTKKKEITTAIKVLEAGGVIILPTDTVLGFATKAENINGQKRIYSLKRRSFDKPLILFLSDKKEIKKFVSTRITELRERLIEHFWPGPLTLVFRSRVSNRYAWISKKRKVAIRIPDHSSVMQIVKKCGALATTSANLSNNKSLIRFKDAYIHFHNKVDFIFRENAYGDIPSTILDVSDYPFVLLRKGPISVVSIEEVLLKKVKIKPYIPFNILFVCTGNTCRSPIAMGLLRKFLPTDLSKIVKVKSRGTDAIPGSRISYEADKVLKEIGIDLSFHTAEKVDIDTLNWADIILAMERKHYLKLSELGFGKKVRMLSGYSKEALDIKDPAGGTIREYRETLRKLENPVKKIVRDLIWRYDAL